MKKLIDLRTPDADDAPDRPSALEVATAMQALQDLGARLVALSEADLAGVPLDESLRDAVELARRLDQPKAIERQLQFIGKLMRGIDPAPIAQALELVAQGRGFAAQQSDLVQRWRARLLSEGDAACNAFVREYPSVERQRLRQLARQARKDGQADGRSARELTKLVRAALAPEPTRATPPDATPDADAEESES